MPFMLNVHLREIAQEEERTGCSLRDYTEFIKLIHEVAYHLREEIEVGGITGPNFQTTKHNSDFIKKHFPSMTEDFVRVISEYVNFKFKEVTEELKAKTERIKKEKWSQPIWKPSFAQKPKVIKAVLKGQVRNIFRKEEEKPASKLTTPVPHVRYQERNFWANADEKMAKLKGLCERKNLSNSSQERSEASTQI